MMEDCPTQTIVFYLPQEFDIDFIKDCVKMSNGRLKFGLNNLTQAKICHDNNWPYYFNFPITTFEDLNSCILMGVTEVILGAPLAFQMELVKKKNIPIRAIPNIANQGRFIKKDGVTGQWIRPENIPHCEEYIDIIEFGNVDLKQEQALFRIYKAQSWIGNLDLIIQDLNHSGSNYLIDPEMSKKRFNCGQICESRGSCHSCYLMLDLANPKRYSYLNEEKE